MNLDFQDQTLLSFRKEFVNLTEIEKKLKYFSMKKQINKLLLNDFEINNSNRNFKFISMIIIQNEIKQDNLGLFIFFLFILIPNLYYR